MPLQSDSSIVAVNCVHVKGGMGKGGEDQDGFIIDVSLRRHVDAVSVTSLSALSTDRIKLFSTWTIEAQGICILTK